ncbi:MAG: endolytic transglycosylase MltG [Porticoccaceae bacterium]|nr:endolytic transglycosylase MltG [Porticoccaceae bacterium]
MIRRFILYFVGFTFAFSAIAGVVGWFWFQNYLDSPLELDERVFILRVPENSSLTSVTRELGIDDYLRFPRLLLLHARLEATESIQVGEYELFATDTPRTLLSKLHNGEVLVYRTSLIEGWTTKQMLDHLRSDSRLRDDIGDIEIENLPSVLDLDIGYPEGWFYPDTYVYARGLPISVLLVQAHERMRQILEEEWASRSFGVPYETSYEALIMASIVEKETGVAEERAEIAGVFVRRLEQRMRLQTDPTVIYGLGDSYDGNLTRAHLQSSTPYNTYTNHGLPPTPIANPGRGAINAALNPNVGSALYFVGRGDGSHQFSDTLAEHNAAVRQYQIEQRAEDYRSAPSQP